MDHPPPSIPAALVRAASCFGNSIALIDGDETWNFTRLLRDVRQTAAAFLALGIGPGDRVAIWAPNSRVWILAACGAQWAGAALVPLNTRLKGREAADMLRRAQVKLVVSAGQFLGIDYPALLAGHNLPGLKYRIFIDDRLPAAGWRRFDDFVAGASIISDAEADAALARVAPDDVSDIIFTSGTTGAPKGAVCTHGQSIRLFTAWAQTVDLRHGDRYLIVNPFFHTFGYKAGWLACVLAGATIVPLPVFDVGAVQEAIGRHHITFLPGPPTLYQALLDANADFASSGLRVAVTGAAMVPPTLVRRMQAELGFEQILTGYGMTECGVISLCRTNDTIEHIAHSSGRALPGLEVKCIDAAGAEVAPGTAGEILVRGFGVMRGYLDDPAATAAAIDAHGWLHTGDIGVLDDEGYVCITDRKSDMFISGGFNCYPAEIENLLARHPAIERVAVVGLPDARLGEVGWAYVVPRAGSAVRPDDIIDWARSEMANYKVPRQIVLVTDLPVNASGKVLRRELKERAKDFPS